MDVGTFAPADTWITVWPTTMWWLLRNYSLLVLIIGSNR
jgi:hypothetical protein